MSLSPPICLAMLICDSIYVDVISERVSALGLFDQTRASRSPASHAPFSVYFELSGGRGRGELTLEVCYTHPDSLELEPIAEASVEVDFSSSQRSISVSFRLEALDLEEVGEYGFTLLAGETVVAERWLLVTE